MEQFNKDLDDFLKTLNTGVQYNVSTLSKGFGEYVRVNTPDKYNELLTVYKQPHNRLNGFMKLLESNSRVKKVPCGCAKSNQKYILRSVPDGR